MPGKRRRRKSEIDEMILEVMKKNQGVWMRPKQIVDALEREYGREFNASYIRRRVLALAKEGKLSKFGSLYSFPFPEGVSRYLLPLYTEDVEFIESLRQEGEEFRDTLHRLLKEYRLLKNMGHGVDVAHVNGEG
jgi:hypothetical protein